MDERTQWLEAAKRSARAAGKLIRESFGTTYRIGFKGRIDLVTEIDTASEKLIQQMILDEFPRHGFLGEEGASIAGENDVRWIVDPLDGTRSFAHGYPFVAVSIAVEVAGSVELGVVYDPLHDELFEASRNGGARLNGEPIRVSSVDTLGQALMVTGFPYHLNEIDHHALFGLFQTMVLKSGGIRRDGAAALDFCYIAAGRTDGFWFFLKPWDAAAGSLIVSEAGGRITDLEGNPFSIYRAEMLCSNGIFHEQVVEAAGPYLERLRKWL